MIKTGLYLGTANFSVSLLSLLRNVLVARLISVEDFGIASTFAIVMALVEMTSNIALDRLIVQARDGETPILQATLQAIQAIRGALGALVLFLIAGPLASLFGIPEATWAYQVMAVIPLLRGLSHLDMFRLQREMRFLPSVTVEFVAQFLSTAAAVPLALELGDYRAMLWAVLLQQFAFTIASHVVADRPYRWGWDGEIVRRAVVFGWPLLLNGLLMFGILQGDRIIVGSLIGMTELGWFSAAYMLTLVPSLVLAKTLGSFFLPQLAQAQNDEAEFERLYIVTIQASLVIAIVLAVTFALIGAPLLLFLYGVKYETALSVLAALSVMQAIRVARTGPSVVAMAKAETRNPLITNVLRVLALPVGWFAVTNGAGVGTLVAIGILGEAAALIFGGFLLKWRLGLPVHKLLIPSLSFGLAAALVVGPWQTAVSASLGMLIPQLIVAALPLLVLSAMPTLRSWLREFI